MTRVTSSIGGTLTDSFPSPQEKVGYRISLCACYLNPLFHFRGQPSRSSIARVERAHSYRARSASRKTIRLPFPSFGGRALREHRRSISLHPLLCSGNQQYSFHVSRLTFYAEFGATNTRTLRRCPVWFFTPCSSPAGAIVPCPKPSTCFSEPT